MSISGRQLCLDGVANSSEQKLASPAAVVLTVEQPDLTKAAGEAFHSLVRLFHLLMAACQAIVKVTLEEAGGNVGKTAPESMIFHCHRSPFRDIWNLGWEAAWLDMECSATDKASAWYTGDLRLSLCYSR